MLFKNNRFISSTKFIFFMDVKEAIQKRKSVRKYQDKIVSEDLVHELIEAGRLAPSGCNRQGARYKAIVDKETIEKLKENKIFPQAFVYTAPVLILCCYDKTAYPETGEKEDDKFYGTECITRSVRDLSIASSFIVLRATELGLGTCYVGWMDKEKVKRVLDLPLNIEILFTITVGYPDGEANPTSRKSINEIMI